MAEDVRILVLSGSMGAGKSTVLGAASDLLRAADIRHAALDLDALSQGHYTEAHADELMLRNLAAVWSNYAAAGVRRALLSEPIDNVSKRDQLLAAIPATQIVVCRLRADLETMQERVRVREQGDPNQEWFVEHVAVLESYLDAAEVEDFSVDNDDGRAATEVAREVLTSRLARPGVIIAAGRDGNFHDLENGPPSRTPRPAPSPASWTCERHAGPKGWSRTWPGWMKDP